MAQTSYMLEQNEFLPLDALEEKDTIGEVTEAVRLSHLKAMSTGFLNDLQMRLRAQETPSSSPRSRS